ncbi:unnamed protein product [Linum trigynum]|uniref:Uncharacterized protein n=1 Tax=Linum trigynum TaxID=586398 RepID=A0AAV2D5Y5_9ROSI
MVKEKVIVGALIVVVVLLAIGFLPVAGGEMTKVTKEQAIAAMANTCMPVCMRERGATVPVCRETCEQASIVVLRNPSVRLALKMQAKLY